MIILAEKSAGQNSAYRHRNYERRFRKRRRPSLFCRRLRRTRLDSSWRNYANGVDSGVLIVETPAFMRRVLKLMSDQEYRELQQTLVGDPERGAIIRHSGGLRKIRWARPGRGKRGGVRAIY